MIGGAGALVDTPRDSPYTPANPTPVRPFGRARD